jgi:predicted  nucleic acid-binding Zn-ribbon protein
MKAVEVDEGECENIRKQIEEQKQELEQTRKKVEGSVAEHEAEIGKIQAEWNEVAKGIPRKALEVFNRVAETYDGEAVATIEQQEGRTAAYSCGGCYMGVPAESVNVLMSKDEIIRCPNCTRILVLSPSQEY